MPDAITPALLAPDGSPALGKLLDVSPDGVALKLQIPAVAPARLEMATARITLKAPTGSATLTDTSSSLRILTDLGPGGPGGLSAVAPVDNKPSQKRWVVADWGVPRALTAIRVDTNPTPTTTLGRLRIDNGGAWYPPSPKEIIAFNAGETLPAVIASRVMIEVVANDAARSPAQAPLSALSLTFAAQPSDLVVAVGSAAPVFEHAGQLLPGEVLVVERGLAQAITALLPPDGAAGSVVLTLRAGLPGQLTVTAAEIVAARVRTALDPPAGDHLALPWNAPARGALTVAADAKLTEVGFRLLPELAREDIVFVVLPAAGARHAQLASPRHAVAQRVAPLAAAVAGVDVYVRPTARVAAQIALHPDHHGRPAQAPFGKAVAGVTLDAPGAGRWVQAQLPKPLQLPSEPFWIVLSVQEGELLCPLVEGAAPAQVAYRVDEGRWLLREVTGLERPTLACRVRGVAEPPAVALAARLRRGSVLQALAVDGEGRAVASAAALGALKAGATVEIEVTATPPPGRAVAGELMLKDFRVLSL